MPNIKRRKRKLLLHICCAGCGAYVSEMLKKDWLVTLYFYNPNIYPENEYLHRLAEVKSIAYRYKLDLIIGKYDHHGWLNKIKGYEHEPERGERCFICYRDRLEDTAKTAKEKKHNCFSTTLTISPHKDASAISKIGNDLADKYKIKFLDKDFKKKDGFTQSALLSRELGLYRQGYCGCEFS